MRHIILFDTDLYAELLPITATRPASEIRWGILTNRQKWDRLMSPASFSHITSDDLEPLFPIKIEDENTLINGSVLPTESLAELIRDLRVNEALMLDNELIAAQLPRAQFERLITQNDLDDLIGYQLQQRDATLVKNLWDLPTVASEQIIQDMALLGCGHTNLPSTSMHLGQHPCYLHPTATIEHVTFNTNDGPIYIGPEALVMDGTALRGPVAINEKAVVKMGSTIYGGSVIGPHCVVGGEIKNSLILEFSNKAHEGYLGDSVIGSWCNLGALTCVSNLKNTLSHVRVHHTQTGQRKDSGRLKCGIFMADFCRTGIHTKLNAGTVIGPSSHLFGPEAYSGYIPAYTWGKGDIYQIDKAIQTLQRVQALKGVILDPAYIELLQQIYTRATDQSSMEQ